MASLRRLAACTLGVFASKPTQCEESAAAAAADSDDDYQSKMLFVGSGSSTGCPKPLCSMLFQSSSTSAKSNDSAREMYESRCDVSKLAIQGDPKMNKNYRNNPCLLLSHCDDEGEWKNIIIDVGKTFREGALRWFPEHNIQSLDAIVLTHEHMDAAGGLDDVRGFQFGNAGKYHGIPVHLSQHCLDDVAKRFTWLFPNHQPAKESEPGVMERSVANLDTSVFTPFEPFSAAGLDLIPIPVWHGDDLISFGFAFTLKGKSGKGTNVVYLSDISRMVPESLEYILDKLPPTDILIVDALLIEGTNPFHFNLQQAVDTSQQLKAKKTFLVGMNCDSFLPHDEMNKKLKKDYGNIQLAYDGQVLHF